MEFSRFVQGMKPTKGWGDNPEDALGGMVELGKPTM
jgi:hypothetical protein